MRRFTILLSLVFTGGVVAQTEAPSLGNLVSNPPFGTAQQAGGTAPATGAALEFRGTFVEGGERFFSLVDTATRRGEWVGLNEADRPFVVRNFDPDSETITVDHQGRTLNLKLHSARIGVLPQQPVAQQGPPQPGTVNIQPSGNQPSSSEAQRLAQVAEEIRRRRALRQQSANPTNQPQNSQPQRQP